MLKFIYKIKENIFAVFLSILIHSIIFSLFFYNTDYIQSALRENYNKKEVELNKNNNDDYVILIDPIEEEEKVEIDENTRFVSDKSARSSGVDTEVPNFFASPLFMNQGSQENNPNTQTGIKRENNNLISLPQDDIANIEIYKPDFNKQENSDNIVPSNFDEGVQRAVIFSSNTGQMKLGAKALPYYWYFKQLVSSISRMWNYTIPTQAHFLGLLRSDEVEILLSIDAQGNVEFVNFLKESTFRQTSLNNSCKKAIEYTGNIGEPPVNLYNDYQKDGKIYIPFRFIYQNFLYNDE